MMDVDAASFPPRLDPTRVPESVPFPGRPAMPLADDTARHIAIEGAHGSTRPLRVDTSSQIADPAIARTNSPSRKDLPGQAAGYSASPRDNAMTNGQIDAPDRAAIIPSSSSNSLDTNSSNAQDRVFTPPLSEGGGSQDNGTGRDSSQESQLFQLSQLAAARSKQIDGAAADHTDSGMSRKRTADGAVKMTRSDSNASPVEGIGYVPSHSRTTSSVSMASTSSRLTEVSYFAIPYLTKCRLTIGYQISAKLSTRLAYASIKVSNGWQSQNIDQVEMLASQAASPASSTSTVHLRSRSSASPHLPDFVRRDSASSARPNYHGHNGAGGQHYHGANGYGLQMPPPQGGGSLVGSSTSPALAPPATIQPSRPNGRRNSNPTYTPPFLGTSHAQMHSYNASPNTDPRTPAQSSGPHLQTSHTNGFHDPILFSPHQDARDQDAIEALIFMKSPANSNNMRHAFPQSPSTQPLPTGHERPSASASNSQRRALPSGRPSWSASARQSGSRSAGLSYSQQQPRRIDLDPSPTESNSMEIDEHLSTPRSKGTPRRKANGGAQAADGHIAARLKTNAGLSAPDRPRRKLADEDIERMLDSGHREESSDSEGEIELPPPRARAVGF
jgi:hypothetical protein